MFIAMNRFRVKKGSERAFEKVWLGRDTYLDRVPGFLEFHLLKGPEAEDHTLYSSHSVWQSKRAFEAWTKSEEFRAAHARAGNETTGPLYLEHPKFEGFEVRQTITARKVATREPQLSHSAALPAATESQIVVLFDYATASGSLQSLATTRLRLGTDVRFWHKADIR